MAKYTDNEIRFQGRKTNIEDTALNLYLKCLRKHIALVFKYGDPKTVEEAKNMVEKSEERFEFSEDESSEDEIPKKSNVNWTRSSIPAKCQLCEGNNKHEALTCTVAPCAFCNSSFHRSNDCNVISENRKIKMSCKLCPSKQHTIDLCPEKNDGITYCQFCQASNCHASNCNTIKSCKTCAMCGEKEHDFLQKCPMNNAEIKTGQYQTRQQQGPCFNCQGPHNVADCPNR